MFGFRRNAIQVNGVEKFFEKENRQREKARKKAAPRQTGRVRRAVMSFIVLVIIAALGMLVRNQQTQIAHLRALRNGEVDVLQSRVSALSAELQESGKQVQMLKESIAGLEKELEAEQAQRVKAEAELRGRSLAKRKL